MQSTREENIINAIRQQQVVVKTISADPNNNRCLDFILDQLANPGMFRPVKPINPDVLKRYRVFNPKSGEWKYRDNDMHDRSAPKNTTFTKKNSVTLLPPDGRMNLYVPKHGYAVGLIFETSNCDLNDEKYIFAQNANTDEKWWLRNSHYATEVEQTRNMLRSVSLSELKKQNIAQMDSEGVTPSWNEMAIRLGRGSLIGVFAVNNTSNARMNALQAHYQIYLKLGTHLPLLIITPKDGVVIYSKELIESDISSALRWDSKHEDTGPITKLAKFHACESHVITRIQATNMSSSQENTFLHRFFYGRERNTNYLSYEIPYDVIFYTLGYLSFSDLIKLRQILSTIIITEKLGKSIEAAINANHNRDLNYTLAKARKFNAISHGVRADVLKMYLAQAILPENKNTYWVRRRELTERMLAHLFCNDMPLAISYVNWSLIHYHHDMFNFLLAIGIPVHPDAQSSWHIIQFKQANEFRHYFSRDVPYERMLQKLTYTDRYESVILNQYSMNLCPLLYAALHHGIEKTLALSVIYPERIGPVIAELKKINPKIDYEFNGVGSYIKGSLGVVKLKKARNILLSIADESVLAMHSISHTDKCEMKKILLEYINQANTSNELNQLAKLPILNHRRHPIFDSLFRGNKNILKLKDAVLSAIESRRNELNNVSPLFHY